MTKQQLREELKQAMLSRDTDKTGILRLLISAIKYHEINKGGAGYEATEEDVLTVIQKEVKQRKDSIEQFTLANRMDLAEKEDKELKALQQYLPAQMPENEIRGLVKEAITKSGASTPTDIGKVMGIVIPQTKGKADGSLVSKIVREELA